MAAYALAASLNVQDRTAKTGNMKIGIFQGSANLSNYNSVLVAVTAITGRMQTILSVTAQETSSGYTPQWVTASSSFKMWQSNATTGGPLVEVPDDTNVGTFNFQVVGLV